MTSLTYDPRYPGIAYLKERARRRMPRFAFDYLDAGIDGEQAKVRNRRDFDAIELVPRYFRSVKDTVLGVELFGQHYDMAFGVSPVGLGNMLWPGAESALARAAQKARIPYVLSTYSTTELETIAQLAPDTCWFQLYVPQDRAVMADLIQRARAAGFRVLVVTLDIPVGAKRNRELHNGLKLPFSLTPSMLWQGMIHPAWALQTGAMGLPDFVNIRRYGADSNRGLSEFITSFACHGISMERLEEIRSLWDGPLVLKGIQDSADFIRAVELGADGVIVSNHGGRQIDAAPSSIVTLRALPEQLHEKLTLMLDSGVRSGLDVIRARALGAQACFSGRSFFYGVGALGLRGADQVVGIFADEISRSLKQLGCDSFVGMDASWLRAPAQMAGKS